MITTTPYEAFRKEVSEAVQYADVQGSTFAVFIADSHRDFVESPTALNLDFVFVAVPHKNIVWAFGSDTKRDVLREKLQPLKAQEVTIGFYFELDMQESIRESLAEIFATEV